MKRTWLITGLGIVLGAAAGWAYWYWWGCTEGCAITSSPVNSSLYGGLMGALLVNSFKKETPRAKNIKTDN
jgi:integral membrane sensor domain MASE1